MKGFGITYLNDELIITPRFKENEFDNFMYEDEHFSVGVEGVILNLSQLKLTYNTINSGTLFIKIYGDHHLQFLQQFSGEYGGWLLDKKLQQLYIFTNYTATKKVFYQFTDNVLVVDTDLLSLVNKQKGRGEVPALNTNFAYTILTVGHALENQTPIEEVYKLRDAEYISFNIKNKTLVNDFYTLPALTFEGTKAEAIEQLHQLFQKAVRLEYEKDLELGLKPFALLSGGLDSRIALLSAVEQGFKLDQVVCFSQKGYWDETIAREIAKDYNLPFQCIYLNGAQYLKAVDEVTSIAEGMIGFIGGVHTTHAFKQIDKQKIGLVHSGQLGDGVLGGFNLHPFKTPPTKEKIILYPRLFNQLKTYFEALIENYDSEELFYLRNIGYNRAVLGSYVAEEFSYQTSPFMHPEFLQFAQSLPEHWKINQAIYIEWVTKFFPKAVRYRWERTLLKPNATWKTSVGDRIVKRTYNIFVNRILGRKDQGQMTAYDYYYHKDPDLIQFFDAYFNETIYLLSNEPVIQKEVKSLFKEGTFNEKMIVITLLATMKRFFT